MAPFKLFKCTRFAVGLKAFTDLPDLTPFCNFQNNNKRGYILNSVFYLLLLLLLFVYVLIIYMFLKKINNLLFNLLS